MSDDIRLRFSLAHGLLAMKYGDTRQLTANIVDKAWPPTGDYDRSEAGFFKAMALAAGGNRPEESYTTMERINNDLDNSFLVERDQLSGGYSFHRRLSACPRCRGAGVYKVWRETEFSPLAFTASVPMDEVVSVEVRQCDHKPGE